MAIPDALPTADELILVQSLGPFPFPSSVAESPLSPDFLDPLVQFHQTHRLTPFVEAEFNWIGIGRFLQIPPYLRHLFYQDQDDPTSFYLHSIK